jgi:CheY-like chemotaxis protein
MATKGVILCIDDEEIILNSLEDQLSNEFGKDYILELAQSGYEGLDIIKEFIDENNTCQVLVIISDWLMPGMKGDEFLIKAHKLCPNTVKIMLTGQADNDAIAKAKALANLKKCFSKPWDAKELIEEIKQGLQNV